MPAGRPTKYDPKMIRLIQDFLNDSKYVIHTRNGFAKYIGVNEDTLVEWEKVYPAFSAAIKAIMENQQDELITRGLSGKYNPTMSIFLLKANHGMIETEKRILAGDKNEPLTIELIESNRGE